jgi:hypothetical protein
VSEALTNTTKHAHASHAHIAVEQHPTHLHLSIHDDGIGGADPAHGSGLTGLRDRVHALTARSTSTAPRTRDHDPRRPPPATRLTARPVVAGSSGVAAVTRRWWPACGGSSMGRRPHRHGGVSADRLRIPVADRARDEQRKHTRPSRSRQPVRSGNRPRGRADDRGGR